MLKKLFKRAAPAASQEESSVMTTQETQPVLAVDNKTAEMATQLAKATENMTAMTEKVASLQAELEKANAKLDAVETEKATLAQKAKEVVMASRKEKMEAVLGSAEASPVLASLEGADDATFNTVLSAFAINRKAEANSEMFQEKGVVAEAATAEEDPVKRLAARMAANYKTK